MRKPNLFTIHYNLLLILCLLLTGCHKNQKEYQSVEIEGQSMSLTELYDSLAASYRPWSDVYLPVSLSLSSPTSFSISGRATMVRGQSIHMSLRMLGMEVAIIHVEGDSAFVVDKYHKKYLAESISGLLGGYSISIGDMQDLLLGQAFMPGAYKTNSRPELAFDPDESSQWMMMPSKKTKNVEWWCTASKSLPPILTSITFELSDRARVDCVYSSPSEAVAGIVNSLLNIGATTSSVGVNAQIKWTMKDAKWNSGRSETFKISSGYQRLDASSLLSSLKM